MKFAIAKTNTPEQMAFQMKVVDSIKRGGCYSVGIRFEEFSQEVFDKFRGQATEAEAQDILSPLAKWSLFQLLLVKVA